MNSLQKKYLPLEDLVDFIVDNRGKTVPTSESGIPLIATNCIKHSSIYPTFENIRYISQETYSNWFRAHLRSNDILFVNKGTPGRVCIVPNPVSFVGAQDMVGLRFKKEYHPFYMLAVLRSKEIQNTIQNNHVGLVIPHFRKQELVKLKLPILEKIERDKIGEIYFNLSSKIELNNRSNSELEQMAKTLYNYWFVQFDFPNEEGKPYKSSGGKMVYNEILKREIPDGWKINVLSEINSELVRGISPKYSESNGIPVINQRCIRNNVIDFSLCRLHNVQLKPVKKLVEIGDILVNSTGVGTLGRVAIVKRLDSPQTTVDSHVTIVRANINLVDPLFLGFSLVNKQSEIEKLGEGSTGQTELSRENLGKLPILLPKQNLQNDFTSIIKPLFEKIANNEKQNQELASLRDWLLPMLMNGQVKIDCDEISKDNIKVTSLNIPTNKKDFAKQVLAGKIVSEFKEDPNFTGIKFQKIQFLAEHIIEADLNLNYYYQAAGPYDNKFMHTIYTDFQKQKWFDCQNKKFIPLEKQMKIEGYFQGYFAPVQEQLNKLFQLMYQTSEAESEIIATLYAVWNNRIIEGKTVKDNQLLEDFYQWSDRKLQYTKEQVFMGLRWLKENQMEPKGFGKLIKKAQNKK